MKIVKLGSIIRIVKGKKATSIFDIQKEDSVRFIQIDDLRNDNNLKFTDEKGVFAKPDDVIIAWDGANAGTIGYGLEGIIGSTLAKLEIQNSEVYPRFLGRFLQSKSRYFRDGCTGATIPHINKQVLTNIHVSLPSIEDQKRTVKILDQADALLQKRKQAVELLNAYLKSVFLKMFGDLVKNPKEWKMRRLSDIADIASGVTKGRKIDGTKTVLVPYMRVANVQDEHIDLTDVKEIEALPSEVEKYKLLNGDLLLTEGGDPDKLGRGGIWRGQLENCIHQNHIFRVRLDDAVAIPEYVSAEIGSAYGKMYFLKSAKQTTGIASINMTQLKNFPVLLPDLRLQIEYSKYTARIELVKQQMLAQSKELENQFQALTQKAFKGEL